MPADDTAPDKLSIVVFSGEFDKVHYALVMASGAAAIGRPVTLFFTMEACRAILAPDADGAAAWRSTVTTTGANGGEIDDMFADKRVATFEELLEACIAMEVKFMVCEMGLRAMDLPREALREDIPFEDGGVVTFLNDASQDGAMLFI